ncbi:MAG: 1,6-anhydro-N-acetylmuramyl-L-alanine amidase AmpD [Gammaproteobacteria bacterium]|nr:1,6-anhydro-N-acetylmuramyl-L-alanine amidase AmpD [Gammaproteobacteria bacterium]
MRQLSSPHCDERPEGETISLLVIHNISLPPGQFGGEDVEQLFMGTLDCDRHPFYAQLRGLRVSSHLFIRRDGDVLQFVPYQTRAWHAGVSRMQGRERCNDFSIGIELEGTDHQPYTDAQYLALAAVSRDIMRRFPAITLGRIVGHNDIAPGRKTDPGPAFDWPRFRQLLSRE